jgi:hypothetical protein
MDELSTPIATYVNQLRTNDNGKFSFTNINYLMDEGRYDISVKFHQNLPTMSNIPPFTPTKVDDWKDKMKSYLRSCYSLDSMLRDQRESMPIMVELESVENYQKRVQIYKRRDRAFYLLLDKSLNGGHGLDPKYLALSEQLNNDENSDNIGHRLFDGLLFLLKGSHLWARIDSINSMVQLKLTKIGEEQAIFNAWKREVDIQNSLQLDLVKSQKLQLIHSLNSRKEHKTVLLQFAAMTPEELFSLSPQQILDRFLASAGHLQGGKEVGEPLALVAEVEKSGKRKNDPSSLICYFCHQPGHMKSGCPKMKKHKIGASKLKKARKLADSNT